MPSSLDSAQVESMLYEAGRAFMALRVPGCWPAGFRSGMPACQPDPEDMKYAEAQFTVSPPSPGQISAMDRVLGWVRRLPSGTPAEIRLRRIVMARMLVSPKSDRPLYSWRRLGTQAGISHVWAKTLWLQAISDLTAIANRDLAPACAGTLARIRAHGSTRMQPVPPSSLDLLRQTATREPPAPCVETIRRIQEGAAQPAELVDA